MRIHKVPNKQELENFIRKNDLEVDGIYDKDSAIRHFRNTSNQYKAERDILIDDIAVVRANNEELERELATALNGELATYDELQKYVLELQSDLMEYKKENEKLNNVADEAMDLAESENSKVLKLEHENKALRLQADTYFDEWQNAISKNKNLQSVIEQFKHDLQYTEWEIVPSLKRQSEQQAALLKDFSKFINYKLEVVPANETYKYYRRELDKLGVK
ncbi:hypothetical protein [Staphylococcus xylosus]